MLLYVKDRYSILQSLLNHRKDEQHGPSAPAVLHDSAGNTSLHPSVHISAGSEPHQAYCNHHGTVMVALGAPHQKQQGAGALIEALEYVWYNSSDSEYFVRTCEDEV